MTDTYPRKVIKSPSPQVFHSVLTTRVQTSFLDDRIDHLDSIICVRDKLLDGVIDDGALTHHQTFTNTMAKGGGDLRCWSLTNGPIPFLGGPSSSASFFLLVVALRTTLGIDANVSHYCL